MADAPAVAGRNETFGSTLDKLIQGLPIGPPVSKGFRFGLGIAIAHTTGPDNLAETIELAKDRSLGYSRLALLLAIRHSRKPEIRQVIEELSSDPDLAKEIASWKRRK